MIVSSKYCLSTVSFRPGQVTQPAQPPVRFFADMRHLPLINIGTDRVAGGRDFVAHWAHVFLPAVDIVG